MRRLILASRRGMRPLVAVLALACTTADPQADVRVTHPYRGITYTDRIDSLPRPVHMHVAQIDLTTPGLRFMVSPHNGPLEVLRETTLDFLKRERAQLAVNAHFFWPWPSEETPSSLVGIAASEGAVYSECEHP